MPERKVTIPFGAPGETVGGFEVHVDESNEKWSEYTLSDGTVLRGKLTIVGAVRIDGQYDPQGNPMYSMNMTPTIVVSNVPDRLKQKGSK
jgi:hypothetical protein